MRRVAGSIFLLFFISALWHGCTSVAESNFDALEEGFKNPPVDARPRGLWDWTNGNFDFSRITYDLEEAKDKGMGGFDIWDVGVLVDSAGIIPHGPAFMGDESLEGIAYAVKEANRLGLELGLITASSWNAGGAWVKPEHGVMGLFRSSIQVNGGGRVEELIPFPELPTRGGRHPPLIEYDDQGLPSFYREVAVLAFPLSADSVIRDTTAIQDISRFMTKEGKLSWQAPEGEWQVTRYVCAPTGQPLMVPSPNSMGRMLDHFSAEAMKEHMQFFFDRLQKELGTLENQSLKYLYEDSYEANSAAWTPQLPEFFEARRGYPVTKLLPVLDGFTVGDEDYSKRFMYDFTKTLSDLIVENHYKLGTELAREQGLGFYAEAGGPGPPVHNVPFEDLRALGALTVPRGEFWRPFRHELQIIKGISSAAHIYDQKYVEAESFTGVLLWQEGPGDLKAYADRAMCEGLNRFIYHTFPHVPHDAGTPGWVYNFGTLIYPERIWWQKSAPFHHYIARSSYLLQQGNFVGDVAFYYGDHAPNFVEPKEIKATLGYGYDYDVINSEVILEKLDVQDGRWMLPHGQSYAVLVLPENEERINPAVLEKLEKLVRKGGILGGKPPRQAYSLYKAGEMDEKVKALVADLWKAGGSNEVGNGKVVADKTVREILLSEGVLPDFVYEPLTDSIGLDFIHRSMQDAEIYFVRNSGNKPGNVLVRFRATEGSPEFWHPGSGKITPVRIWQRDNDYTSIPLSLEGEEALFVVFRRTKTGQDSKISVDAAVQSMRDPANRITAEMPELHSYMSEPFATTDGWNLKFDPGQGARQALQTDSLRSWTEFDDHFVKHYSGKVVYETSFEAELSARQGPVYLDLGAVEEVAEAWLNGQPLGIRWHAPYRYEVSAWLKEGKNSLVVEVVNNYNNKLVGDAKRPEAYRLTKSNIRRLPNAWSTPMPNANLLPSGMLGPVRWIRGEEVSAGEGRR